MTDSGWVLAVDFGTSFTAVAASGAGGLDEVVEIDNERWMPSGIFWQPAKNDHAGRLLVGDEALNAVETAPDCLERCPKARMGEQFITLGGERIRVTDAIGEIFRYAAVEAKRRHNGVDPGEVRLTHPARWRGRRLSELREAAAVAGFREPIFVPEPVGAALFFATETAQMGQLRVGERVAVYDLGGGTFDTAVLERSADGFTLVGEPGGIELMGGEKFDERLYQHLGAQLDVGQWQALRAEDSDRRWQLAAYDFRASVRRAKERLSREGVTRVTVRVPAPVERELKVSRSEFEDLIRNDVERTVAELERTVIEAKAGMTIEALRAIYLAGGSSRIPLVEHLIVARLGKKPDTLGDPKSVIARGAVRATALPRVPPPDPMTPAPDPIPPAPEPDSVTAETPPPPIDSEPDGATTAPPAPPPTAEPLAAEVFGQWRFGAVAVAAAVVIGSLFLPQYGSQNAWSLLEKNYGVAVIVLMLLTTLFAAVAWRSDGRVALTAAAALALWACGLVTLFDASYKGLRIGFWLGAGASIVLAMLLVATVVMSSRAGRDANAPDVGAITPRLKGYAIVVVVGVVVLGVSSFIHDAFGLSAWSYGKLYVIARLVMCVLVAALLIVFVRLRRTFAAAAAAAVALVLSGSAAVLGSVRYAPIGAWLGAIAGLVVAVGCLLIAWNASRMRAGTSG